MSFKTICGERGGVDQEAASDWKRNLVAWIQTRNAKDIWKSTRLPYFRNVVQIKRRTLKRWETNKERITFLNGSETLPLLMISNSCDPRCYKNKNKSKAVDYEANKKAWMTSDTFERWLLKLDKQFSKQKRTILLFIDNCTCHNSIPILENTKVLFSAVIRHWKLKQWTREW